MPRNRDDERIGTGGKDQLVIAFHTATARGDCFCCPINRHSRIACDQFNSIIIIPCLVVDDDVFKAFLPREQGREHDAVVIHPRFRPENCDPEPAAIAFENFLDRTTPGHAIADNDQVRLLDGIKHVQVFQRT